MLGCVSCGNLAIEQRDLKLCASCNRERRKPPVKLKPKQAIKPVSTKKAQALAKLAKTKVLKREEGTRHCEGCGCTDKPLSHSHILSVGQFPQYESDPANITYECYGYSGSCHEITETGTIEIQEKLANWPKKLRYILKHAPEQLEKIKMRSLKREKL